MATWLALALTAFACAGPGSARGGSACGAAADRLPADLAKGKARAAVRCLVNRERRAAGLRSLDRSRRLQRAAQRHTRRMAGSGCFSHRCSGEPGLEGRLRAVGYILEGLSVWRYKETIGWGLKRRGTPRAVVANWMTSAPHRSSLLDPGFRDVGVGFTAGSPRDDDAAGGIYTVNLGFRSD